VEEKHATHLHWPAHSRNTTACGPACPPSIWYVTWGLAEQRHLCNRDPTPVVVSEPDRLTLDPTDVSATQGPWRHARIVIKHMTRGFAFRPRSGLVHLRNLIQAVLDADVVSSFCPLLMASMRSRSTLLHPQVNILSAGHPGGLFERKARCRICQRLLLSDQHRHGSRTSCACWSRGGKVSRAPMPRRRFRSDLTDDELYPSPLPLGGFKSGLTTFCCR